MSQITEQLLQDKLEELIKQKDNAIATVHAINGAIQNTQQLLDVLKAPKEDEANGS